MQEVPFRVFCSLHQDTPPKAFREEVNGPLCMFFGHV